MNRNEEGFTLFEALVALAITAMVMAIAARLLIGSQYLLMAASREARDPVVEIAIRQLRNDIQGSGFVDITGVPTDWSSQPMVLRSHPRYSEIRYERTSDLRLVRTVQREGQRVSRDIFHGVTKWRWANFGGLVSLRVSIRRQAWRGDPLNPNPDMLSSQPLEDLQWLNFAMRGRGLAAGW